MNMKRFLVLEVTKYLNGTYSTSVVFESVNYRVAFDKYQLLCEVSSDFQYYILKSISFPEF